MQKTGFLPFKSALGRRKVNTSLYYLLCQSRKYSNVSAILVESHALCDFVEILTPLNQLSEKIISPVKAKKQNLATFAGEIKIKRLHLHKILHSFKLESCKMPLRQPTSFIKQAILKMTWLFCI